MMKNHLGDRIDFSGAYCVAADAFRSTSVGIIVVDSTPRIVLVNETLLAATGYRPEEVANQHPRLFCAALRQRHSYRAVAKAILSAGHWHGELLIRRRNGEIYPVWARIDTMRDRHGQPVSYVAVLADVSKVGKLFDELHRLAYYDPLTGLPNRQLFADRIEQAIAHAHRDQTSFSLLFMDLDRFKETNDRLGHRAGDSLLREVARRLRLAMREADTVARLGGDEFVIIVERTEEDADAAAIATKILQTLASPSYDFDSDILASASIGIARYPHDGRSADELMRNADQAMYQAKSDGRGRYRFHHR
jgi:diguanylate cyclase (GGDEF)-like protein/PAS domain S-box-containing protein